MFSKIIELVAKALQAARIPYMLIGGQAVLLYGEPRLTRDIDITVGLPPSQAEELFSLAQNLGLRALVENPSDFTRKTSVFPCVDDETSIRIDFIFSWSPYESQALKRVRKVKVGKTQVRFASPEDLIIHKIIAGRPRDLEDIRSIIAKNSDLDDAYIGKWLSRFDEAMAEDYVEQWTLLRRS